MVRYPSYPLITPHPSHLLFVPTTALTRSPAALTSSARLYRRIASTAHASHYRLREPIRPESTAYARLIGQCWTLV